MLNRRCILFLLVCFCALMALEAHASAAIASVTQTLPATTGPIVFPDTAIGASTSVAVQLTLNASGTLTIVAPASAGNQQEFTVGTVSGCATDGTTVVTSGSICSFNVTFTPHYPGQRSLALAATLDGQVYPFGLTGFANGPLTRIDPAYTLTVAGRSGTASLDPVFNVPASQGILYLSRNIFVDASDNVYIADTGSDDVDVIYQTANPQLACLIITETPASFGASGNNGCADATSQPTVGNIYQLAGIGSTSGTNTGGILATKGKVLPDSVFVDTFGNVYMPDGQGRIRVIYQGGANFACLIQIENPTLFGMAKGATSCSGATSQPVPGYVYNVAGTGTTGTTGDGGLAISAEISNPGDVFVDSDGDIFFSTFAATSGSENGRIRVIYNGGALAAQLIKVENPTVTTPVMGYIYSVGGNTSIEGGDGTLATSSSVGILASYGLKLDRYGNVYFSDKSYGSTLPLGSARIRVIYNGTASSSNPLANLIAKENPGTTAQPGYIYTIAGSAGVAKSTSSSDLVEEGVLATSSHFVGPYQIALDAAGDIIVADDLNDTIRRISVDTGLITTILGQPGVLAVQNGMTSELYSPWGVALSSAGDVYFVDNGAYRLRAAVAMDSQAAQSYAASASIKDSITLPSGTANTVSGIHDFLATNIGTTALSISTNQAASSNPTATFGFLSPTSASLLTWAGIDECQATSTSLLTVPSITSPVSLNAGDSCQIGVATEATSAGSYTGWATLTDNSQSVANTTHTVYFSATATGVSISFAANPAAPTSGQSTQLIATLANGATPVTSGTVHFSITGGVVLGSTSPDATGTATISTNTLPVGTDSISIVYDGDTGTNPLFTPATLVTSLPVAALPVPTITVTASPSAVSAGASVLLTAKVVAASGTPTGTVSIIDMLGTNGTPATICSTTALDASGIFSCSVTTLPTGTNNISAIYSGDENFANASTTTSAKVTVSALPTTTTVSAPATIAQGQSVTLTATVSGYLTGVNFNGAVTFNDSFTPQGSATAVSLSFGPAAVNATTGVATYQATTLLAGTHVISASFANDMYYGASSSTTNATVVVTVPSYSVTPTAATPNGTIVGSVGNYSIGLAAPQGSQAVVTFSIQTVGGYANTVTPSCSLTGTASVLSCAWSPTNLVFTGANNTVTVTATIDTLATSASNRTAFPLLSILGFPGAGLMLFCLRRKRTRQWQKLVLVAILLGTGLAGAGFLSGCGTGSSPATAPLGVYTLSMNFTDGTNSYSVPVTLTVQGSAGH